MFRRGLRFSPCPPRQVFNANNPTADLTPVSDEDAERVKAGWAALLPGQEVPLIGEAVYTYEPCDD